MAGDVGSHVRVAVAVAAHPRGETHRDEVHRQLIAKVGFQLFVQLAQIVRHPFPQAIFHHREAPFGFVDRRRAVFTDLVSMPGLGDQLAQTAHQLMVFVVGDVFIVQLLEAAVHFHHFMDQRPAGDLGRVGG